MCVGGDRGAHRLDLGVGRPVVHDVFQIFQSSHAVQYIRYIKGATKETDTKKQRQQT